MVKLGKNQLAVLDAIKAVDTTTIDELVKVTGIDVSRVKNIVREFGQAEIIKVSVDNMISWRTDRIAEKNQQWEGEDNNEWEAYKPKLKNLSRIV